MRNANLIRTATVAAALAAGGCAGLRDNDDQVVAQNIALALAEACPMAAPNDEDARALCAAHLTENKWLAGVMNEPFMWGAQKTAGDYHFENSNMNRFNVLVWRRMYASLLMFPGGSRMELRDDGAMVMHVPFAFRNGLDMGSYPYPFWHAAGKWQSYQQAKEMLLVVHNGKWLGAMRSADQDAALPKVAHTWSGQWHWERGGVQMPYVSLYTYLLSPQNPYAARLDQAYRTLSDGLRQQSCFMCHSPDNYAGSKQLEFFNYPNQALYARNDIIADLQANKMPPMNTLGLPQGIANANDRAELLSAAQEFKAAGDLALGFEGELKP